MFCSRYSYSIQNRVYPQFFLSGKLRKYEMDHFYSVSVGVDIFHFCSSHVKTRIDRRIGLDLSLFKSTTQTLRLKLEPTLE